MEQAPSFEPMKALVFLISFYLQTKVANTVKCHQLDSSSNVDTAQLQLNNRTCEGDFCAVIRSGTLNYHVATVQMTCVTGVKKPSAMCTLDYDDNLKCFCDTDYCNTVSLLRSNVTVLPVIECKSVFFRTYVAAACNVCIRKYSYKQYDDETTSILEEFLCSDEITSGEIIFSSSNTVDKFKISQSFFTDACYNVSLHPNSYDVFCRCKQANCNTPQAAEMPYPISPTTTVTCQTAGINDEIEGNYTENYQESMKNDTFADEGLECRGMYCFIALIQRDNTTLHYKGCVSATEKGENKIKMGYSYLNNVGYYFCNTEKCNSDIETAKFEAENSTGTIRDNSVSYKNSHFLFLILFIFYLARCQ